jgi:hypothetical protein
MSDHELVPVEDATSPTGIACATCNRPVADYRGVKQHRRGGAHARKGPSRSAVIASMPGRLEAVEERLEDLLAADAETGRLIAELAAEIRAWTSRQPIYVEMRPRHQRAADGGEGGNRETRRLRKVVNG